jgi:DNA polymerase
MKDKTNPAYDPRNNNVMCINGQLMLLDLIEHLEVIPGFQLIQSNTDGLIIWVPDTQESFDLVDDICYDWESRCSTEKCEVLLALDRISEIWQKDVNNYLWKGPDGSVERIGAYVKGLSRIDNDLPIINRAMVEYMVSGTPVEQTIMECDELLQFQKVVKLSSKYHHVEHEHCEPVKVFKGRRTYTEYPTTVTYSYKSYRVFASLDPMDGRLLKVKVGKKGEKFGNTPDHCWIDNSDMTGKTVPEKLDRAWYVEQAKKRLKDFGVTT